MPVHIHTAILDAAVITGGVVMISSTARSLVGARKLACSRCVWTSQFGTKLAESADVKCRLCGLNRNPAFRIVKVALTRSGPQRTLSFRVEADPYL